MDDSMATRRTTMSRTKLIIIGGRGNGTVLSAAVRDCIAEGQRWDLCGFLNDSHEVGDLIDGYPVLGRPDEADRFAAQGYKFSFTLLSAKKSSRAVERLQGLRLSPESFATVIHPTALVSAAVQLGHGISIMPFTFVGPNACLGDHMFIHGHSYVARDTICDAYSYLAPRVTLGAEARTKEGAYLGTASSVLERLIIGQWSVVGMGSVVIRDVPAFDIVAGNPARRIGTNRT